MLRPWRQTYSPIPFLSHLCPCIRRRNGGHTPLPNVWSFHNASRCREWPWSSVPRLYPLGRVYLGTGWSGRSVRRAQSGRVGTAPEGGSQRESGYRAVSERRGTPRLPHGFDPSRLRDGTRLPDPYPKVFRMSFLQGPSRSNGQGLGGT